MTKRAMVDYIMQGYCGFTPDLYHNQLMRLKKTELTAMYDRIVKLTGHAVSVVC